MWLWLCIVSAAARTIHRSAYYVGVDGSAIAFQSNAMTVKNISEMIAGVDAG